MERLTFSSTSESASLNNSASPGDGSRPSSLRSDRKTDPHCPSVGKATDPGRFLHADHYPGIEAFPDPRHREEQRRRDLPEIIRYCLEALGKVGNGTGSQGQERSESALGYVAQWQERQLLTTRLQRNEGVGVVELKHDVAVAQHRSLRRASCARCVDEQGQLLGLGGVDELFPQLWMIGLIVATKRQEIVERKHLRISKARKAFEIEDDHVSDLWAAFAHVEILVELLLIIDKQEARTAILEDVLDLFWSIGRIDAVGDPAGPHDAHVGIKPFRLRLGEDRNNFPTL